MTRQQLVIDHLKLAAGIAANMSKRLPRHVDLQDLEQDARIGLMEAAGRFDSKRKVSFGAYARRRISGAIVDGLRRTDHLSRDTRRQIKAENADAPACPAQLLDTDDIPGILLSPETYAVESERDRLLGAAVAKLPGRWRIVLRGYYRHGMTMREIGRGLGVNESRVSQIHKRALGELRTRLVAQGFTTAAEFSVQEVWP